MAARVPAQSTAGACLGPPAAPTTECKGQWGPPRVVRQLATPARAPFAPPTSIGHPTPTPATLSPPGGPAAPATASEGLWTPPLVMRGMAVLVPALSTSGAGRGPPAALAMECKGLWDPPLVVRGLATPARAPVAARVGIEHPTPTPVRLHSPGPQLLPSRSVGPPACLPPLCPPAIGARGT